MLFCKHEGLSLTLRFHIKKQENTLVIPHWGSRDRQVPGDSLASQQSLKCEARNTGSDCVSKHTVDGNEKMTLDAVLCPPLHTYVHPTQHIQKPIHRRIFSPSVS